MLTGSGSAPLKSARHQPCAALPLGLLPYFGAAGNQSETRASFSAWRRALFSPVSGPLPPKWLSPSLQVLPRRSLIPGTHAPWSNQRDHRERDLGCGCSYWRTSTFLVRGCLRASGSSAATKSTFGSAPRRQRRKKEGHFPRLRRSHSRAQL